MKLRLAQSFCFMLLCSSALTAQTTQAIDVELHNVTLAEALVTILFSALTRMFPKPTFAP